MATSWYVGANVSGRRHVFKPYAGGFAGYTKRYDAVAANGHEGFVMARQG